MNSYEEEVPSEQNERETIAKIAPSPSTAKKRKKREGSAQTTNLPTAFLVASLLPSWPRDDRRYNQACKLKFRLRDLTLCLCSAAAPAVCFNGRGAGVDATETGYEFSKLKFQFTSLAIMEDSSDDERPGNWLFRQPHRRSNDKVAFT